MSKEKPTLNKELDRLDKEFKQYNEQVAALNLEDFADAPVLEQEPQTKLSQREMSKAKEIRLKPIRTFSPVVNAKTGVMDEKFNEKFRKDWEFAKEYVCFIAENKEVIGEAIDIWTKPFPGVDAEEWKVPCNKPVWGPRYLAEQIRKCQYHVFKTEKNMITNDDKGAYYGEMVAKNTVHRLDANPAVERKSIFMGASSF